MSGICNCPVTQPGPTLASTCGGSAYMLFMGLLEVFIRSQCDIEDPCGRPVSRALPDREYDFIVVGGGTAGSVVASRLSEVTTKAPLECMCRPCTGIEESAVIPQEMSNYAADEPPINGHFAKSI